MNDPIKDYNHNNNLNNLITEYNSFNKDIENFVNDTKLNKIPNANDKQKKMCNYWKELDENIKSLNPEGKGSIVSRVKGEGLKISTNKQILNRLPILLAQIQAGNNCKPLKNELRQILYSLYRSKVLTNTVYNNLIKVIVYNGNFLYE